MSFLTATRTDPESIQAGGAVNVAIELMSSNSTLTPESCWNCSFFVFPRNSGNNVSRAGFKGWLPIDQCISL